MALQPAFFHDGAFTRLEDAVRYHLNANTLGRSYDPAAAGLPPDLCVKLGPMDPVLGKLDARLADPTFFTEEEIADLVEFLRDALLDERAKPENLMKLIPAELPSGLPPLTFEGPAR